ncbi:hypothetical protein H131_09363 [Lysinibacillus sphaericus OT4b.31]|uniref:Uncharacterized protein n=1 Tax=Lysinibacillus sphaericus OT4b.31 TaxID=1285586 RepID=R7ZFT6_LYSSH|nr:hypothetical protein H131_09363 [Lysinibacillus sphaericus OT4b.31]
MKESGNWLFFSSFLAIFNGENGVKWKRVSKTGVSIEKPYIRIDKQLFFVNKEAFTSTTRQFIHNIKEKKTS